MGALLRHLTSATDFSSTDRLSAVLFLCFMNIDSLYSIYHTESPYHVFASPTSGVTGGSVFAHLVQAPEDPILGVTIAYNKDPSPIKVNLGVGAYRTEGKLLVLNDVRKAEQQLISDSQGVSSHSYIPGVFAGTGSLRVGGEFLAKHYHQPTWGNHPKIFTLAGLLEDLGAAPQGSIVLLHACAHNPTGVDPTLEQWEKIRQLMRSKGLMPFFDSAYQVHLLNLFNEWTLELKAMADRIISMRKQLFEALRLNPAQVSFMTKEYHIYMTSDGRISMAGLSSKTVPHLEDSIHAAVTKHV
ncbi:hypothetical protein Bca4012_024377 [Brassica carinata]